MDYLSAYRSWCENPALNGEGKTELASIAGDTKEIEYRFGAELEFGTAGMRGIIGYGTNMMNVYTVRRATQGLAEYVKSLGASAMKRGVVISYDTRRKSEEFARASAGVLAANGIAAYVFDDVHPVPMLSYAVRRLGTVAGIMITASHNPKEYNGYKVYWSDGAQLPPGPADKVAAKMQELDVFDCVKTMDYKKALDEGRITLMGTETDEKFLANVMEQVNDQRAVDAVADTFKMVYTPFHGTGYKLIPEALRRLGMKHVICVSQQMIIDGDFPTVVSPNPENPEGFALAVDIAKREGADFILGSDPDADRVGIMVRTKDDDFVVISGNQTGVLLLDYLIGAKTRTGKMPANPVALKSLVTTEMARKVAEDNGLKCFDTFTGFKFLAEKKDQLESSGEGNVIMSYEESFGYMLGSFVRDKDAVTASVALTEMAAWYAGQGMTLYDALQGLYEKYGHFGERTMNLVMPGLDGLKKMAQLMADLRANPPKEVGGTAVAQWKDYQDGSVVDAATGERTTMELSGSNVLRYELVDGTSVIVRPSGTEPKVKVYILARGESQADCAAKVERYATWAESLKG